MNGSENQHRIEAAGPLRIDAQQRIIEAARRWFLLRTKANHEKLVAAQLRDDGFNSYFPLLSRRVRRQGKRIRITLPLFPSYLFVEVLVGEQALHNVRTAKGALGLVRFGEEYAVVAPSVVALLQRRADPRTGLHHLHEPQLRPHAPVRITGGPFEHLEGVFVRECGDARVLVLLQIVGSSTPVKIDEAWVEPVPVSKEGRQSTQGRAA